MLVRKRWSFNNFNDLSICHLVFAGLFAEKFSIVDFGIPYKLSTSAFVRCCLIGHLQMNPPPKHRPLIPIDAKIKCHSSSVNGTKIRTHDTSNPENSPMRLQCIMSLNMTVHQIFRLVHSLNSFLIKGKPKFYLL